MPHSTKYAIRQRLQPTVAPLTAAVSLALAAGSLQAATITVDTLDDGTVAGQCTLRDAFEAANYDAAVAGCSAGSGGDEIVFASGLSGTLALTEDGLDGLVAYSEITVTGPGSDQLTIDGGGTFHLFGAGYTGASLSLSGLTLSNGYGNLGYGGAAAIAIDGADLSLSDCVVSGNVANAPAIGGGAVSVIVADLTITDCDFEGNEAAGGTGGSGYSGLGGAVFAYGPEAVTISDTSFSSNYASYAGGAIAVMAGGDVNLTALDLSGNEGNFGGGVALLQGTQAVLSQSTVSGNYASAGGGLFVSSGSSLDITTSSVNNNFAYYDGGGVLSGAGQGGVIYAGDETPQGGGSLIYGAGDVYIDNSTLADNEAYRYGGGMAVKYGGSSGVTVATTVTGNLAGPPYIRSSRGGGGSYSGGGGGVAAIYGGEAYLAYGSELINNQAVQGGGMLSVDGFAAVVESLVDGNYAYYSGGGLQSGLMGPVISGNDERGGASGGTTAVIGSVVSGNSAFAGGGVLTFSGTEAIVYDSSIEDNYANVGGGVASYNGTPSIKYSQVSNNYAYESGGGVLAMGATCEAYIDASVISGNSAAYGGGVYLYDCAGSIQYSVIVDNQATSAGGLLIDGGGAPELFNSTVTGNSAVEIGGLYGSGVVTDFITVSHNTATGSGPTSSTRFRGAPLVGGAMLMDAGISNSIFSDNAAPSGPLDLETAGSTSLDYSLVQSPGPSLPAGAGNLIGEDPLLGPLADNGGNTSTRALAEGSPAIDVGDPGTVLEYDQRGEPFVRASGGRADMGAYELFIDGIFSDRFEQGQ